MKEVITSGYVSMDRIVKLDRPAKVGFTSLIENKTCADICYGGCSVNISYDLSKIGVNSMPIMRVGDDYEKIGFKKFLEDANISLKATEVIQNERTSLCYLLQDNEGQHITLFYPGAMDGRFAHSLSEELFEDVKLAVICVGSREDNEFFLEMCKKKKIPIVFSMKGDMNAFPKDFLQELLEYSTIIATNEIERATIESIYGRNMEELLKEGNCTHLITTLGSNGSICTYLEEDKVIKDSSPICSYGACVDTTGCGDSYLAGFIYGYLRGYPPKECAMLGSVHASFIIEKEGCCTAAPNESAFLERYHRFFEEVNR